MLGIGLTRARFLFAAAMCLLFAIAAGAQTTDRSTSPAEAARLWTGAHTDELIREYSDLLRIPNVAADPEGLRENANFLLEQLRRRDVDAQLLTLPGDASAAPPVVYGRIDTPGAAHTIVFYGHYDGQPVSPADWDTPTPFTPTVRTVGGERRIYARGAADDKAAIFAQLTAVDALRSAHLPLRANIRFVWEGEEEADSAHLEQILAANSDLVHGDLWLICDGPVDPSGRQLVVFGVRGLTHLAITVYGAHLPVHSGHYGNWAPILP